MSLKTKYSPLQHFSIDNLYTAFSDLSPRNRLIALVAVGLSLGLILFLPLSLLSGKVHSLRAEISSAQEAFQQVQGKLSVYQKAKKDLEDLEKRYGGGGVGTSLTTRIEKLARQSGVNVDQLTEKAQQETDYLEISSVEVKISNVSLSQLLDFLYHVENHPSSPMRVRRIQIKPKMANRQGLDITCEVAAFVLKKEV